MLEKKRQTPHYTFEKAGFQCVCLKFFSIGNFFSSNANKILLEHISIEMVKTHWLLLGHNNSSTALKMINFLLYQEVNPKPNQNSGFQI